LPGYVQREFEEYLRCGRLEHGVYIDGANGAATRFRWVKVSTSQEFMQLAHTIAQRIGRYLERQGLLGCDAENSYLASDTVDEDPMNQLLGSSMIAFPDSTEGEVLASFW